MEIYGDVVIKDSVVVKIPKYEIIDAINRIISVPYIPSNDIQIDFDHIAHKFYNRESDEYIDMPKTFFDECYKAFVEYAPLDLKQSAIKSLTELDVNDYSSLFSMIQIATDIIKLNKVYEDKIIIEPTLRQFDEAYINLRVRLRDK
ncbi:MAG: hypothetical protein ACRDBY_00835 [Cetobacterium sp.]